MNFVMANSKQVLVQYETKCQIEGNSIKKSEECFSECNDKGTGISASESDEIVTIWPKIKRGLKTGKAQNFLGARGKKYMVDAINNPAQFTRLS